MARPPKRRRVAHIPEIKFFKPAGIPKRHLKEVALNIEEVEAIRLKDREGLTQAEAAQKMEVSRPTFQRILVSAREKISEALIEGKALRFKGGDYSFKPRCESCGKDFKSGQEKGGPPHGRNLCPDCD